MSAPITFVRRWPALDRLLEAARLRAGPNSFVRHALAITSGVAFAQAIQVLSTPILTRLYSPAEFGLAASIGSIAGILTSVATLRFDNGIPLANTRKEAHRLATLSLVCVTVVTALVGLLVFLAPGWIGRLCGLPVPDRLLLASLPLLVLAGSGQWVVQQTGTAARAYRALGTSAAVQVLSGTALKVVAGILHPTAGGLLLGELARRVVGVAGVARAAGFDPRTLLGHLRARTLRATARRHRRYPQFSLAASLLYTFSLQAPVLILAAAYSPAVSGCFALGISCVQLPLSLLSAGVTNAFQARLRQKDREGVLAPFVERFFVALSRIGAPWIAFCIAWGPELVTAAFGTRWRPAGTYLALLGPWLFLTLTNPGTTSLLNLRNLQGRDLPWHTLFLVTRLGGLLLAARLASDTVAVATFGAVSFTVFALYALWAFRRLRLSVRKTLVAGLAELALYTIPSLALAAVTRHLELPPLPVIAVNALLVAATAATRIIVRPDSAAAEAR